MRRDYPRLGVQEFGRKLIVSGDLDPVYIMLHRWYRANPELAMQLRLWLIAYWCFYHCGAASYISEADTVERFWLRMRVAAENTEESPLGGRWPRGSERRHFRGAAAVKAVAALRERYAEQPDQMIDFIAGAWGMPRTLAEVRARAEEHPLFGPWISFKIADMLERVLLVPIAFDEASVFMFSEPEKAAFMVFREHSGIDPAAPGVTIKRDRVLHSVTEGLVETFSDLRAPPAGDRPINIQEVETVLCKWKSHMNGHYPLGHDLAEVGHGLHEWGACSSTARELERLLP